MIQNTTRIAKTKGLKMDSIVKEQTQQTTLNSGSFVQRQKRIALYHVKKFVKDSQL